MKKIEHPFVFWSDVNNHAINALIDDTEYLPVIAACEKNNPVDLKSVMILLGVETLINGVSFTKSTLNGEEIKGSGYIRIGYLQRLDSCQKTDIYDFIEQQDGCYINGFLIKTEYNLIFQWHHDDDNVPF